MKLDPSRLTTLVFDVDGTLYRQSGLRRAMLLKLLAHAASNPLTGIATFRALRAYRHAQELLRDGPIEGDLAAAQFRLACERSGQAQAIVESTVARWMDDEPLSLLERFVVPGLRPLLEAARGRGMRLGVLSDYPAAAKLRAMKLDEFFDVVVTAQDPSVNRFKPHPSGLLEALRRLGARPDEALYVGDRRDVDGPVAAAAGASCVIVGDPRGHSASATYTRASDYLELHSMLFSPTGPRLS
jgi:HAD superfamily hydrolase (TIGR01509 family)